MTPTTPFTFQLGDPVEHRGIVITPLFPARDPGRELHHARRGAAARAHDHRDVRRRLGARARRDQPARRDRAALRRRGARRREAEPHPQRVGARRRRREAADPRLVRRAGPLEPLLGRLRRRDPHLARAPAPTQGGDARGAADGPRRRAERGWSEIGEKQERMSVASPTGAARDTFEAYGDRLRKLEDAFPPEPGQCGAVLAIGDALCLDFVSRAGGVHRAVAEAPSRVLLDALERLDQRPADIERIAGFVDEVADAPSTGRVGRARRGRAPTRPRRDRLGPRARRRADPAQRVHELGRRAAGVRADRAAERRR